MPDAKRLWSSRTRELKPYVPGEQPRDRAFIKLNTNENPYGPSPLVEKALNEYDKDRLRLYPDPGCHELRSELAVQYELAAENIFIGNGSDEILALAFQAFFADDAGENNFILFPDITYSFYPVYCQIYGIKYRNIKLDENLDCSAADFPAGGRGLVIANPNAPTGNAMELEELEKLIRSNRDRLVLVDEAYVDFGAQSAVNLLRKYDNLLVVQTFSKSRSLAGMRVGYAMGDRGLVAALERVRDSFNSYTVNSLSQAAALASLRDKKWFTEKCAAIVNTREKTAAELKKLDFAVMPSCTNFLFAGHPVYSAVSLYHKLKDDGILVRHFSLPRIENYLRITIGTDPDMKKLISSLQTIIKKGL